MKIPPEGNKLYTQIHTHICIHTFTLRSNFVKRKKQKKINRYIYINFRITKKNSLKNTAIENLKVYILWLASWAPLPP